MAGAGVEEHPKNVVGLYPLISATVEASNSKFGTQLGFGEYVTITALVPNMAEACWSTGAPQKLCGPGTMYLYHVTAAEM